jgi:hypothetical protein
MRNHLFVILTASIISLTMFGQNQAKFHHILTQSKINTSGYELQRKYISKDTLIIKKAISGDTLRALSIIDLPQKQIMTISEPLKCVITLEKGTPTIDIWQITKRSKKNDANSIDSLTNFNASTFILTDKRKKLGDSTKPIRIPFRAWSWSIGTTPLRLRQKTDSSNSTVSSALGLSISFGRTWGKTTFTSRSSIHNSFTFAPFIGVSTAELKKETVKTPKIWDNKKYYTQTNLAVSYGISGTFARNNLGLVISAGFDTAIGNKCDDWSYQNKPWIGLGINANLGILK